MRQANSHCRPHPTAVFRKAAAAIGLGSIFGLALAATALADPRASHSMMVFLTEQTLRTPAHAFRAFSLVLTGVGICGLIAVCGAALKLLLTRR